MKLYFILQHRQPPFLINVLILFPLKLGFSNMLLVKTFRVRQRQSVLIRLINVDMMQESRFPELCLDGVLQYCLLHNMKTLISQVEPRIPGNEQVVHCHIPNTRPVYANPTVKSRISI